ncbi:MAG: UDP-N-acetylmuramoyl-L-alanyl-D-glutamate--2,6-diaminopimelate ligase [Jatrophihabitans sp.]
MSQAALPRPQRSTGPVSAERLARLLAAELHGTDASITGITAASGRVVPGDLFVAIPGANAHGVAFFPAARAAGAVAVLTDSAGARQIDGDLPVLVADDPRAVTGPAAAHIYGDPSARLRVIGVTGTSGKTTTTFLIRAGLIAAGRSSGLIGTVGTFLDEDEVSTGFTTPEAAELQSLLAVIAERGMSDVVMEVSSHGLSLGRVNGTRFTAGGFTNLSMDHLDFHPTMEAYFAAKAALFDRWARRARIVIDDDWGRRLAARAVADDLQTVSVTDPTAGWHAESIAVGADGATVFRAVGPGGAVPAGCRIPGAFNVANALLALSLLDAVGVPPDVAAAAIATAQVPGRMERVDCGQPFLAIVDYAHKPAAVAAAVQTLRPLTPGRLITVLGCGGDRDRMKRPVMGAVAAQGSDLLIVTDDNPRTEDPATIRAAMLAGAAEAAPSAEVRDIGDRAEAIAAAVRTARAGDTVLVAGKGHEPGQEIAGVLHPFDDRVELRRALGSC